jgi:threonine dehydrogenase-like Zn-dependent dehydrogenase
VDDPQSLRRRVVHVDLDGGASTADDGPLAACPGRHNESHDHQEPRHGGPALKALVFRHNLAREAASTIAGRVDRRAFVSRIAPVRIEEVEELPLPGDDWVRVETTFSGLCGSDVKQILLNGARDNPLTALVSFPHVLGHEVVGRRGDTGERVVLNPWLSCVPRGIDPPCSACQVGRYPWCRNFRSGNLPVSIHLGNCAAASGAHAERFAAHVSQLFAIPDQVSDEAAVLADPVSVSLRSILLAPPPGGQPVLVYGSGTLAYAAVVLLRHLYPDTEVWAATRAGPKAALATRLGAHVVLPSSPDDLVAEVARLAGTTPLEPWSKRNWLQDGPAVVYDTVGSTETVETSLRLLDTGGTLVISGVEPPKRFEWTPLYFKELHVIGSNAFGIEDVGGVTKHAIEHYFDFVARGLDLTPVITHRFPLDRWDEAVLTLKNSRRTGAVKILLEPGADRSQAAEKLG